MGIRALNPLFLAGQGIKVLQLSKFTYQIIHHRSQTASHLPIHLRLAVMKYTENIEY